MHSGPEARGTVMVPPGMSGTMTYIDNFDSYCRGLSLEVQNAHKMWPRLAPKSEFQRRQEWLRSINKKSARRK